VLRRTSRRLEDYAPEGGGFYHLALKGTEEFTDNKSINSITCKNRDHLGNNNKTHTLE
jgi:hypothetical protein